MSLLAYQLSPTFQAPTHKAVCSFLQPAVSSSIKQAILHKYLERFMLVCVSTSPFVFGLQRGFSTSVLRVLSEYRKEPLSQPTSLIFFFAALLDGFHLYYSALSLFQSSIPTNEHDSPNFRYE